MYMRKCDLCHLHILLHAAFHLTGYLRFTDLLCKQEILRLACADAQANLKFPVRKCHGIFERCMAYIAHISVVVSVIISQLHYI